MRWLPSWPPVAPSVRSEGSHDPDQRRIHDPADEGRGHRDRPATASTRCGQRGGSWTVSTHPARLFSRNEAITALTLVERLAARR
jgi:hypothetical protein